MEHLDTDSPRLKHEYIVYKMLGSSVGIPRILWFGVERGYRAMVMSCLGPSLETLMNACGGRFSLKTVLMLAEQLVRSC